MKTTIRSFIAVTFGLLVGFGVGLYTESHIRETNAQPKLAALRQQTEGPALRNERRKLDQLLLTFTPESQFVKDTQARIRVLEANEHTK
jgi:uncharacterized protein HemX